MISKLMEMEKLAARTAELRAAGKKVVFTNGCFDLLHVGHVRYLRAARELGDVLAVGINGDDSVRELKGPNRPLNNERDRAELVAALECVDLVTAIYAKGGDYTPATLNAEERAVLEKIGTDIRIIPFEAGYSTSLMIEKLACDSK
jgi:cytidyltransferase-like protein